MNQYCSKWSNDESFKSIVSSYFMFISLVNRKWSIKHEVWMNHQLCMNWNEVSSFIDFLSLFTTSSPDFDDSSDYFTSIHESCLRESIEWSRLVVAQMRGVVTEKRSSLRAQSRAAAPQKVGSRQMRSNSSATTESCVSRSAPRATSRVDYIAV